MSGIIEEKIHFMLVVLDAKDQLKLMIRILIEKSQGRIGKKIFKMGLKKGYIDNEQCELDNLEERFSKLKKKWFKTSATNEELDFLKFYIKQKQNLINQISD